MANLQICFDLVQHFSGKRTRKTQQANMNVFLYIDIKINLKI